MEELRRASSGAAAYDSENGDPLLGSIASASRKIFDVFEREVGMIPPMYLMLDAIASEEGISQAELGRLFEVAPTRVTRLAQKMEGTGLVRRERDPEDNRVVRIRLTPEGREAFGAASSRHRAFGRKLQKALEISEKKELQRLLAKLHNMLDDPAENRLT